MQQHVTNDGSLIRPVGAPRSDTAPSTPNTALISLVFSPPIASLGSIPGMLPDPGRYCFRIRRETGRPHICGTTRATESEPEKALQVALRVAHKQGYTHYRLAGPDGELQPVQSDASAMTTPGPA